MEKKRKNSTTRTTDVLLIMNAGIDPSMDLVTACSDLSGEERTRLIDKYRLDGNSIVKLYLALSEKNQRELLEFARMSPEERVKLRNSGNGGRFAGDNIKIEETPFK